MLRLNRDRFGNIKITDVIDGQDYGSVYITNEQIEDLKSALDEMVYSSPAIPAKEKEVLVNDYLH